MTWLAIGVGGALGSIARYGVTLLIRGALGIALINILGCLLIGLLAGALASNRISVPAVWRDFVFVGLLGGFTTFSTFGLDSFILGRSHSAGLAVFNVAGQVAGGLLAVWIGYHAALAAR